MPYPYFEDEKRLDVDKFLVRLTEPSQSQEVVHRGTYDECMAYVRQQITDVRRNEWSRVMNVYDGRSWEMHTSREAWYDIEIRPDYPA